MPVCFMAKKSKSKGVDSGSSSAIYALGVIGAIVYYVSTASSFWMGVWGIIKSFVWPAILVFELLKFLGV